MSVTDHSVADYMAFGRTMHHDRHGTVHDGESHSCGICNAMRMKALGAYAHRETATKVDGVIIAEAGQKIADPYREPSFAAAFGLGVCGLLLWTFGFMAHAIYVWSQH